MMNIMKTAPKEFLNWLRAEIGYRNLSIREAAKLIGVSHPTVSNIYSYGNQPSLNVARKMAKAFKRSDEEILRLAGLLLTETADDGIIERVEHILGNYKYPETKERALAYLDFLRVEEEKGEYRARAAQHPAPSKS